MQLSTKSNKVFFNLLPFQNLILQNQILEEFAIVGGVGAGKTVFACYWLHSKAVKIPGGNFWFCSRTMKTAKDPGIKTYLQILKNLGYVSGKHFFHNKSESTIRYAWGSTVTFMSSESWKDWVGASLDAAVGDEPAFWPEGAFRELTYRLRPGLFQSSDYVRQLLLTGTPQGLTWYAHEFSGGNFIPLQQGYDLKGEFRPIGFQARDKSRLTLHYPTFLNPYQTQSYIDKIINNYGHDDALIKAHLFGEFCPIFQSAVFNKMSQGNIVDFTPDPSKSENLDLCFDFNVGKMAWTGYQRINNQLFCIEEAGDRVITTDEACDEIISTFPKPIWGGKTAVIDGDATGWAGDTRSHTTDYDIIRQKLQGHFARVIIRVPDSNPSVRTTIVSTNRALFSDPVSGKEKQLLFSRKCSNTIDAMFKTVYTEKGNDIYKPSNDKVTHRSDTVRYKAHVQFPIEPIGSIALDW